MPSAPDQDWPVQQFASSDEFFRRIRPGQFNPNDNSISSAAFTPERMSVNWAARSTVEETLKGHEIDGLASILAELCWTLKQQIEHTPIVSNPAHCEVVGKKTKSIRRQFAKAASENWLRFPGQAADSSL